MNDEITDKKSLTAEDVEIYLDQNTGFFQQHPELMLKMDFGDTDAGSISLVERQMKALRSRNQELELELQSVIRNAQDNQHLLQQTISLSMGLIPCESIDELIKTLYKQLNYLFEIESTNLILNKAFFDQQSTDMETLRKALGDNFPKQQPVCGRLKNTEKQALFPDNDTVQSVAILPLGAKGELGILVLGSNDPTHFDPEMGDLFLLLIADSLGKLLRRFSQSEAPSS